MKTRCALVALGLALIGYALVPTTEANNVCLGTTCGPLVNPCIQECAPFSGCPVGGCNFYSGEGPGNCSQIDYVNCMSPSYPTCVETDQKLSCITLVYAGACPCSYFISTGIPPCSSGIPVCYTAGPSFTSCSGNKTCP